MLTDWIPSDSCPSAASARYPGSAREQPRPESPRLEIKLAVEKSPKGNEVPKNAHRTPNKVTRCRRSGTKWWKETSAHLNPTAWNTPYTQKSKWKAIMSPPSSGQTISSVLYFRYTSQRTGTNRGSPYPTRTVVGPAGTGRPPLDDDQRFAEKVILSPAHLFRLHKPLKHLLGKVEDGI